MRNVPDIQTARLVTTRVARAVTLTGGRVGTRGPILAFAGLLALIGASYLVWPALAPAAAASVGVGSAAAVAVGVRRFRPRQAAAWRLVGAALLAHAAARTVYLLLPGDPGSLKPFVWITFALHLTMLVLLVAGIRGLARSSVHGRVAVIDAAVVLLGVGLLGGAVVVMGSGEVPGLAGLVSYAGVGYLLRDVIIVAVMISFVTAVRWNTSVLLLVLSVAGLLANDALFRVSRIDGDWVPSGPLALCWLVFFVATGCAALDPSMAELVPRERTEVAPLGLGLLVAGAALPFAVMAIGAFQPTWPYRAPVAAAATVILLLALTRIVDVAIRLRRQVRGEQVLRDASAELASALDASEVSATLDGAVRRLLPPGEHYRLSLMQLNPHPTGESTGLQDRTEQTTDAASLDALTHGVEHAERGGPTLEIALSRKAHPDGRTDLSTVDGYGAPTAAGPEAAGPPTLVVRADRVALSALEPRLEVLAMQAGLALERMRLNGEIIRHTNDAYFRSLVQNSADIILIINDENRIQYASPSADSIFGDVPLSDMPLPVLVTHPERRVADAFLERARTDGGRHPRGGGTTPPWTVHTANGGLADVEISVQDLRDDPSIGGLVVTMRDITERRRLERELHYRSNHDALTGLENRLPFSERLEAAVASAKESGGVAAILYIDLDDLKLINDGLGHSTGDAVLITVGERLGTFVATNGAAPRDAAARLGGDEFVVLLAELSDEAAADEAADRLVATLREPVDVDGREVSCRASVGVATTSRSADTATALLRDADLALYAAKGTGKGQWRHYESWMRRTVMARLELRASLERAVDDGALLVHYQPIVDLEVGFPVGFEALVRWQHPTQGLLLPDQFIDVAEESGLIVPIGSRVLATAMRDAKLWSEITGSEPYVGVNVSARQFRGQSFPAEVRRLLKETGLAPHRLMLEITESLLLRDDDSVWQDMQALRRIGVRIAIDDFGTGFSSLSYLRKVPLDVVKLDRLFIQTMTDSPQQRELVEGIVRLTNVLGLQVIAEGIETDEERAHAIRVGCAFGQGYMFSRPMPVREASRWLTQQAPVYIGR